MICTRYHSATYHSISIPGQDSIWKSFDQHQGNFCKWVEFLNEEARDAYFYCAADRVCCSACDSNQFLVQSPDTNRTFVHLAGTTPRTSLLVGALAKLELAKWACNVAWAELRGVLDRVAPNGWWNRCALLQAHARLRADEVSRACLPGIARVWVAIRRNEWALTRVIATLRAFGATWADLRGITGLRVAEYLLHACIVLPLLLPQRVHEAGAKRGEGQNMAHGVKRHRCD